MIYWDLFHGFLEAFFYGIWRPPLVAFFVFVSNHSHIHTYFSNHTSLFVVVKIMPIFIILVGVPYFPFSQWPRRSPPPPPNAPKPPPRQISARISQLSNVRMVGCAFFCLTKTGKMKMAMNRKPRNDPHQWRTILFDDDDLWFPSLFAPPNPTPKTTPEQSDGLRDPASTTHSVPISCRVFSPFALPSEDEYINIL